jgi:hypothetical protein
VTVSLTFYKTDTYILGLPTRHFAPFIEYVCKFYDLREVLISRSLLHGIFAEFGYNGLLGCGRVVAINSRKWGYFGSDLCASSGPDKTVGLVRGDSARKEVALNAIAASMLASRDLLLRTTTHLAP